MSLSSEFDVVGLVAKPDASNSRQILRRLAALLKRRGIRYLADPETARLLGQKTVARALPALSRAVKLLVVLGGDGTLLGVARRMSEHPVPILGVNLGQLGFLTETAQEELETFFARVLEGKFSVEERMMLHVQVLRGRRVLAESRSLNDAVISKSAIARILELNVRIDGRFVAVYHADGIIVATPTGSTAYSLSAGGPIVHPAMRAFCITPICPHALTNRPLVVPDSVTIQVTLESASRDATCTLDGQVGLPVRAGDRLRIRRSATGLTLIVPPERNYFDVLRKKLRWGAR
ncbi:MAG TPA: NAD(+)/NADH kinase [Candidatus Polarisedimenticolia bacterium]|nr:NAD(+)/NADH kinase [Candidatus Polarisedimenticolia bacterium]